MTSLRITVIDVGWGDSMLLESNDSSVGGPYYALIDSSDTSTLRSSYVFLKRLFEKKNVSVPSTSPIFDWVLLTHAHADHGQGLKKIIRDFGTKRFWYSASKNQPTFLADLLRYAARSNRVAQYDLVDTGKVLPNFGAASMKVLWPHGGRVSQNENDNSVVLAITLGQTSFVLTGDAEADGVWNQIAAQIPPNTRFFKVPHHGSTNGTFTAAGATPWIGRISSATKLAISSHVRPFNHPDAKVVNALSGYKSLYRTDQHYHVAVSTDGSKVDVSYSHV